MLQLVRLSDGPARCLDGSPAGYYYAASKVAASTSFHIHLEGDGGGWC